MLTDTQTHQATYYVWQNPNNGMWVMVELASDYLKDSVPGNPRDQVYGYKWCRSVQSRGLNKCGSQDNARIRRDMLDKYWCQAITQKMDRIAKIGRAHV